MRIFIVLLLSLLCCASHAQEQDEWWFDVEVIIFERNQLIDAVAEQFEHVAGYTPIQFDTDVITDYRNPNISFIYQGLASCKPPKPIPLDVFQLPEWDFPDQVIEIIENTTTEVLVDAPSAENNIQVDELESEETEVVEEITYSASHDWLFFNAPEFADEDLAIIAMPDIGCYNQNANYNTTQYSRLEQLPVAQYGISKDESFGASLLGKEDITLEELSLRIRSERGLTRLLHAAWRQKVEFGRQNAQRVRVYGGTNYAKYFDINGAPIKPINDAEPEELNSLSINEQLDRWLEKQAQDNQSELLDTFEQQLGTGLIEEVTSEFTTEDERISPAPLIADDIWQLDGSIKVFLQYVNRVPYLHIDGEIQYRQAIATEYSDSKQQLISITDSPFRRVISTQLHYFDHPLYGMLVEIRRYKTP